MVYNQNMVDLKKHEQLKKSKNLKFHWCNYMITIYNSFIDFIFLNKNKNSTCKYLNINL
jgi:hypothetical protein